MDAGERVETGQRSAVQQSDLDLSPRRVVEREEPREAVAKWRAARRKSLTVAMIVDRHVRRHEEERIAREEMEEAAQFDALLPTGDSTDRDVRPSQIWLFGSEVSVHSNQSQLETNAAARRQLEEADDSLARLGVPLVAGSS